MSARTIKQLLLFCLLTGLALGGLVALPARAATPPPYEFAWGTLGVAVGEFNNPAGLAVTGDGKTIYVADSYNHRIQKFDVDHAGFTATFAASWGTTGIAGTADGEFNTPSAVAVDGSGAVYVADTNNHRIQVDSGSGFVTRWGTGSPSADPKDFDSPGGIAISGTIVYVADSQNNRIKAYDASSGDILYLWGVAGSGPGEFNNPIGVALDGAGTLYVADSDNDRIQKFAVDSVTATFVISWGAHGTLPGQFTRPTGVAVDSSNNVYVADSGNNRLQVFDSDGSFVASWGAFGSGNGEFMLVSGIAVDGDGHSYIADTGNSRVQEFGALSSTPPPPATPSALTLVGEWGLPGTKGGEFNSPTDIALDSTGNVYVVDSGNNRVQKFDGDGNYLANWNGSGTTDGPFSNPRGIAISGTHVYVADYGNNMVREFGLSGTFIISWTVLNPVAIAVGYGDTTYTAGGFPPVPPYINIYVRDSGGNPITQWNRDFYNISDVALNTAGQVFVTDAGSNGLRVQEFTAAGGFLASFGATGSGAMIAPASLAIDRGGNIYVADGGNTDNNGRIQHFGADTGYMATLDNAALAGTTPPAFDHPRGVAVTGDGSAVYVADTGNNRILKFALAAPPSGVQRFGEYGSGPGQFNLPGGIAVDDPLSVLSAGPVGAQGTSYVYVADTLNNRIQKFTKAGQFVLQWDHWWYPGYDPTKTFLQPGGVAYSPWNQRVYVADTFFNRIVYFTPTGGFVGQWGTPGSGLSEFDHPVGVAVDADGYVYVTDTGNNRVEKFFSFGGIPVAKWGPNIAGLNPPLKRPSGIAVDSTHFIYISDTGNHRIVKLDQNGNFVRTWGSQGNGPTQFNGPVGITVGGKFVTIADTGNNRLMKYTGGGQFIAQVGTRGSAPGQFNNVTGVAYDGHGNVWATDTLNNSYVVMNNVWLLWTPIILKNH